MIELIALKSEYGWAYIRYFDKVFFLKPSFIDDFTAYKSEPSDEKTVEKIVGLSYFAASDLKFKDMETLYEFLSEGVTIEEDFHREDFLKVCPREDVVYFLDRVETNLIPRGKYEHAKNILEAILDSDIDDLEILEQSKKLMNNICNIMGYAPEGS